MEVQNVHRQIIRKTYGNPLEDCSFPSCIIQYIFSILPFSVQTLTCHHLLLRRLLSFSRYFSNSAREGASCWMMP